LSFLIRACALVVINARGMIAGLWKHASSFKMETFNKSESEDDSISSASAKSFTLEMPIEIRKVKVSCRKTVVK